MLRSANKEDAETQPSNEAWRVGPSASLPICFCRKATRHPFASSSLIKERYLEAARPRIVVVHPVSYPLASSSLIKERCLEAAKPPFAWISLIKDLIRLPPRSCCYGLLSSSGVRCENRSRLLLHVGFVHDGSNERFSSECHESIRQSDRHDRDLRKSAHLMQGSSAFKNSNKLIMGKQYPQDPTGSRKSRAFHTFRLHKGPPSRARPWPRKTCATLSQKMGQTQ